MVKEGSMKAIIGGAAGVAALGGALLLANTRAASTTNVQAQNPAQTVASTSAQAQVGPMYVDCGEGRMALIRPAAPGQPFSYVECTPAPAIAPQGYATGYTTGYGQPAGYMMAAGAYPAVQVQQPVRERVVYVDRPATRTVYRSRPAARRASYSTYEARQGRSWKKSALIIGGSAAAGAGVGAILDGGKGAKKGAIVGGIGGLVYDLATRNK